jgi:hypothetical protein
MKMRRGQLAPPHSQIGGYSEMWSILAAICLAFILPGPSVPQVLDQPRPTLDQPRLTCEEAPCTFRVIGGDLVLRSGADRVMCLSASGHGRFSQATTATAELRFIGCREGVTPSGSSCLGVDPATASVSSDQLGVHLMAESGSPELRLLNLRFRMHCGDSLEFEVEGYLAAVFTRDQCYRESHDYKLGVTLFGHGGRVPGPTYDIFVGEEGETYELPSPWRLRFERAATLRC